MECAVVGLIVLVSLLALAVAILSSSQVNQWNDAFAHVARRFHGMLHSGGWFHRPSVWLVHGQAQVRINLVPLGGGSTYYVQVAIQQRDIATRSEIFYYQTRESLWPQRRGLSSVEFDWEDFRRRWQVLAEDGDATRHLLSDGVRLGIEMAWRTPVPAEMLISLSPGWLVIRKVWHQPRGVELEAFVERACMLSDQINLAIVAGIEFVAGEEAQLLDEAKCGVCGDALAGEIVMCRRCHTPHHQECWQYTGGCATYGCGGRECVMPGLARLAPESESAADATADGSANGSERPLKPR
jgi:hypothetical protein